jgi:hypothetical protein
MLKGFGNQQLARNLARMTVEGRESTVKTFAGYTAPQGHEHATVEYATPPVPRDSAISTPH